ncbi:siderophore-iron reductase FhuF [Erwinia sp. CPCC 100877]|nr:siderophore-iron reductase FhuF [Erwinia sp. CPCC 100877]
MSLQTTHIAQPNIWLPEQTGRTQPLAETLREYFSEQRPWFNETMTLSGETPAEGMTLSEWSRPATLDALMASYAQHIYRNDSDIPHQNKPLASLWAQWYIGLLVPPLMLALLHSDKALSISPDAVHAVFHETGRVAHFHLQVREDRRLTTRTFEQRLESLWMDGIQPIVSALDNAIGVIGKLIWSNTGYLVNWFLGEIRPHLGDELYHTLRQSCFFNKQLSCGRDNPLFRTVVPRNGLLVRRTCCQRNRLPGVQQCGDCTLK